MFSLVPPTTVEIVDEYQYFILMPTKLCISELSSPSHGSLDLTRARWACALWEKLHEPSPSAVLLACEWITTIKTALYREKVPHPDLGQRSSEHCAQNALWNLLSHLASISFAVQYENGTLHAINWEKIFLSAEEVQLGVDWPVQSCLHVMN